MRWRTHTERPTEEGTTAIIAVRDDADEQDLVLLGIYYWKGGRWLSEETGKSHRYARYWWIPEAELLAAIPADTRRPAKHFLGHEPTVV